VDAGIHGPSGDPSTLTGSDALAVFDVNLAGVVRTTTAFLPLLRRSSNPVIVNVSSGMGSLAFTHDPSRDESFPIVPIYAASKAALTMLTTQYAKGLTDIRINAADPATPRPTSMATAAPKPSRKGRTRSSSSQPRNPAPAPDASSAEPVRSPGAEPPNA
jgi:NAD(P)-dependent dehydrogenase (short-subunit alcohol dehydrogenase family)